MKSSAFLKKFPLFALCLFLLSLFVLPAFADELIENAGFEVVGDGSGVDFSVAVYEDGDGNIIREFPAGGTVRSKLQVKNASSGEKKIIMICALYNENNTMTDVTTKSINLGSNKKTTAQNEITVPAEVNDKWSIKTYAFEDLGNMYSYCESFSFPPKPLVEMKWAMGNGFLVTSEQAYEGYSSLSVGKEASECSQPVTLAPNSMYRMSFMGKGDANLSYGVYSAEGDNISDEKQFEPSADWSINSVLFKTGDDEDALIKFKNNGNSDAYIDNAALADNVVINGGFEDSAMGWELDENCFEISKSNVYEGKRALQITSKSSGSRAIQETDAIPHCKAMIKFKSKCSEDVLFKVLDADSNDLISNVALTIPSSSAWKDNFVFINTMGYDKLKLCFETKTSASRVSYIDDVEFTNLTYPDELVNSDFENGTEGWSSSYAVLSTSEDVCVSGNAACLLMNRTKTYSALTQKTTDILNKYGPGQYYFEAYVKPQKAITGGWIVVRVKHTVKGGSETSKNISISNPGNVWNRISGTIDFEWDPEETEISSGIISIETSMRTGEDDQAIYGDLYIDDVSFFKMP